MVMNMGTKPIDHGTDRHIGDTQLAPFAASLVPIAVRSPVCFFVRDASSSSKGISSIPSLTCSFATLARYLQFLSLSLFLCSHLRRLRLRPCPCPCLWPSANAEAWATLCVFLFV